MEEKTVYGKSNKENLPSVEQIRQAVGSLADIMEELTEDVASGFRFRDYFESPERRRN